MSPKASQTRRKNTAAVSPLEIKAEPSSGESNLELSPASSSNSSYALTTTSSITAATGKTRRNRCIESRLACEYDGQAAVPPETSSPSLPEIAKSMRGAIRDVEAVLGVSTFTIRDELLPVSTLHTLADASASFVGKTALSAYTLIPSAPMPAGLGITFNPPIIHFIDCTFAGEMPTSPKPATLIDLDANLAQILVRKYIQYCTFEFRFTDAASLLTAAFSIHHSARVLFACALALLHAPNGAANADNVYRQAVGALWVEERGDAFWTDIASIEAMLLQLQYLFTARTDIEEAWRVAGACARMVHRLGLHRDPRSFLPFVQFNDADVERRRWALHNVVLVDRWLALLTGRPPALRNRDHADVQLPITPADANDRNKTSVQWRFHIEIFAFSHILGDILTDISSVRALPFHLILEHDARIVAWVTQLNHKYPGTTFEGIELHLYALHARAMLFAPYAPRYAASSQNPLVTDVDESVQARDVVLQSAKAILSTMTEDLARILRQTAVPVGRLVWAPHHILVAGGLLATHGDCEQNVAQADLRSALQALEVLRPAPSAERACGLMARLLDGMPWQSPSSGHLA
ncbi:hypothetical protein AURDEDRAFT_157287 [Auricularia subglabra TFB-10046 SS5]|nr:hypothetical protein AURDEDRAFT_157287 [Auricularia subglabra TFB-10046 SS5]